MCLKCQKFGHYASQCHDKKGKGKQQLQKQFAGSAKDFIGVDWLISKFDTIFSIVSCIFINTIYGVGWYVDNRAFKHMTFNKKDGIDWSRVMMPHIL